VNNLAVPGRDIRIALGYVRDEVIRITGNKQEPFVYGSLGGATVALVPEQKVVAPAPAPTPLPTPVIQPAGPDPRRDYEFAERVGTKEAWDSFLSVHKSGFYAELARSQREKATRADGPTPQVPPVPAAKTPTVAKPPVVTPQISVPQPAEAIKPAPESKSVVAVLPPPEQTKREIKVEPDPKGEQRVIARSLQTELRRVGCDPGSVDGVWSPKSSDAISLFNRHAGLKLDSETPTVSALEAVKTQRGRICPLICGAGQHEKGGRCVALPDTSKPQLKKEAARPPEPSPRDRAREHARERAEKSRERARSQARQENASRRPTASRASCPAGSSPMPQQGRMCCEITPERGASRIFCM